MYFLSYLLRYNWYYHTLPQDHMDNRVLYWPRGRVWGGSSSLNAMVYIRGHAEDYNRWQKEGAEGWDYEHCLPYFRKAQCHELGENRYLWQKSIYQVALLYSKCSWSTVLFRLDTCNFGMEPLSSLWRSYIVFLVWSVGTGEAADLFMCREGRLTIPFIRLLLRQDSRQDTPSLMTWMDTNRRAWAGWIWPFIKVLLLKENSGVFQPKPYFLPVSLLVSKIPHNSPFFLKITTLWYLVIWPYFDRKGHTIQIRNRCLFVFVSVK